MSLEKIAEYSEKVKDIAKGANTMLAPMMLRDFIMAIDLTNSMLAKAIRNEIRANARLKQAEAEAYYDRAPEYLKNKGVKESSEAKRYYVAMDDAVVNAQDEKAKAEAMTVFLKNKLQEFRMAHDDVKKMAYAGDYNNSAYEGM